MHELVVDASLGHRDHREVLVRQPRHQSTDLLSLLGSPRSEKRFLLPFRAVGSLLRAGGREWGAAVGEGSVWARSRPRSFQGGQLSGRRHFITVPGVFAGAVRLTELSRWAECGADMTRRIAASPEAPIGAPVGLIAADSSPAWMTQGAQAVSFVVLPPGSVPSVIFC